MRGEPEPNGDPYRALGLEPGASMAEVKRAYRLLAKAFHPDSAGETAIPRFLAIHAAYEQLKTGRVVAGTRTGRAPTPPPAEPWRADPAKARAARERARTGRGSPGGTGSPTGSGGRAGHGGSAQAGPSRGSTGPADAAGATGSAGGSASARGGRASTGTRSTGRRREARKATMGSTSYDEARDPSDATWSGASWYGPSSGEYWIVNPREYADPRKHGPEYQQRARRPADEAAPDMVAAADAGPDYDEPVVQASSAAKSSPRRAATGFAGKAAGTTAASPTAAAPRWANLGETSPRGIPGADLDLEVRSWLGGPADDPVRRLGLALVAWPPIGLAAAAVIGDVTGCSAFAASCTGSEPLLPWLAQAAILGLLLLLPPVTRLLAGGAVAVLLALVPITAFLIALGGSGAPQAGATLAVLLGVAWLFGVAWAAVGLRQRRAARTGP